MAERGKYPEAGGCGCQDCAATAGVGPFALGSRRLVLSLPYPPSLNRIWRRKQGGGMYKIRAAKDYAVLVAQHVRLQANWQTMRPPYRLVITLWPPDARHHDADNRIKVLQDALWAALGQDDVTVQAVHVYRSPAPDRTNPRAEVVIEHVQEVP